MATPFSPLAVSNKRKYSEDEKPAYDLASYEEYVERDNEKLRAQMKDVNERFERLKKHKERLEERLKNESELRINTQKELENEVKNSKNEADKMKAEKIKLENLLKLKEREISRYKEAFVDSVAEDNIECDKCDFKTRSQVSLILHSINHSLSNPNQRRLILHPHMFNAKHPNTSYLYVCPLCPTSTSLTRNEIYPHIYLNHTREKAYKCSKCDVYFTHLDYLRLHFRNEHEKRYGERRDLDIPKEVIITTYYKPIANKATQTAINSLSIDATNGISAVNYSSPAVVSYSQILSDDTFKCTFPNCTFTTNNQQKLTFHISAHTNSKYKCPYCPYVGNILSDIYRHVKKSSKHEGKKVFQCSKCEFAIDCERSFREHMRSNHCAENASEKDIDGFVEEIFMNKHNPNESANVNPSEIKAAL